MQVFHSSTISYDETGMPHAQHVIYQSGSGKAIPTRAGTGSYHGDREYPAVRLSNRALVAAGCVRLSLANLPEKRAGPLPVLIPEF